MYYKKQKKEAERGAAHGFNLYKPEKSPALISKAVDAEIKKQDLLNKAQKKELVKNSAKTRGYKKSGSKAQTLGSLKSLSSIKFK
jgi:hypothetical protein